MDSVLIKWSKLLAMALRHKPEAVGIELDEHGWAEVAAVIGAFNKVGVFNLPMLETIVRDDEKKRYAFSEDKTRIRANQGHSVQVDVGLTEAAPLAALYHGTGMKYVESINREGVLPRQRLYVHLSGDIATARSVGRRHGKPFVYKVLAGAMAEAGYKFYLSANEVWLTERVPAEFLRESGEEPQAKA